MRIPAYAVSVLLVATIFRAQGASQDTKSHSAEGRRDLFANRWQISKGGIGMVNKHLYIDVKSDSNELIVKPTEVTQEEWKGKSATKSEVVIVYQNKVWSPQGIPDGFDLSKAVIVSFEGSKIRYLDFQTMSGGYYERIHD